MSPKPEELAELLGMELYKVWTDFCGQLEERFSAAPRWNRGGMRWRYECQYRRREGVSARFTPERAAPFCRLYSTARNRRAFRRKERHFIR